MFVSDDDDDDQFEAQSTDTPPPKKRGRGKGVLVVERNGVLGKECRGACGAGWLPLEGFSKHPKAAGGRHSTCRVCANAASSRWNADNTDRAKANKAHWYAANVDRAKANSAHWYAENTDRAKVNNARWQSKNTDRAKALGARWHTENAERSKANSARWKEANPDKVATHAARRLERFLEAGPDLPPHIKLQVWEAAEGLCEYCGTPVPAPRAKDHMEHRLALTRGGDNSLANRGVACKLCQTRKGTKTLQEWINHNHILALSENQ